MTPSPRSLILDLLSTLRRGSMPVAALVAAGELFGLASNSLRVALARLLARGEVERDERGRYRLGPGARAREARVAGWRRLGTRTRPWGGRWLAVHEVGPSGGRRQRAAQEHALALLGFAPLAPGLWLRPDNLRLGLDALRAELAGLGFAGLGLGAEARLFRLQDLDASSEARARSLWDLAALAASYRESQTALAASSRRLDHLASDAAQVETFVVGGRVLRQLVRDPLLPEEILPGRERAALLEAMRRYDAAGRACWAGFLERYGVPHHQAPTDTGWERATPPLAATGGGT